MRAVQPLTKSAASLTIMVVVLMAAVRARGQEQSNASVSPKDTIVYVGTYTGGKTNSQGIYAFKMQGGIAPALVPLGLVADVDDSVLRRYGGVRLLLATRADGCHQHNDHDA